MPLDFATIGNTAQARISGLQSLDSAFRASNPFDTSMDDTLRDKFVASNSSYSGTDCTVVLQLNDQLIALGNLETFSYSIFREKAPVRVLGKSHPKAFTAGGRTISGSMVFVVFDKHPLYDVIQSINYIKNPVDRYTTPVADQLPPLDLIIIFNNEYGHTSILKLYAVEFIQEGQVHSINDIYSENTTQYVARDIDIMVSFDRVAEFKNMLFERMSKGMFVDNHLESMLEYKRRLENQIAEINTSILKVDQENARRSVAGITTLGISNLVYFGIGKLSGSTTVTKQDLNENKDKQLRQKALLLDELSKVNHQIKLYENNIKGWNSQNSQNGVAGLDSIRTSAPSL